nr:MAG TPA: hypothetical protein [Caudoviricetes sp.]
MFSVKDSNLDEYHTEKPFVDFTQLYTIKLNFT